MAIARVEASEVERAIDGALESCGNAVLAVSGGLDSMVLLTGAARVPAQKRRKITVATFDHGTGSAAGRAAAMVHRHAAQLGISCVTGRAYSWHEEEDGVADAGPSSSRSRQPMLPSS